LLWPTHRTRIRRAETGWLASHPDAALSAGSDMINASEFRTINGIDRPEGNFQ
jgi:hypothetical protein